MNQKLSIALCQMMPGPDKAENLARASKMIDHACQRNTDLIILPEVFNSPYQSDLFPVYAETYPGPTTEFLSRAARDKGVGIIGGSIIEQSRGRLYNSSFVFDEQGNLLARHRKLHLFDVDMPGRITFKESDTLSPGNNITLFEFRCIKIGLLICYDIRFPEICRALSLAGAELLVVPAAFNDTSGPLFWEVVLRSRAVDQQIYVAAASPATNKDASYQAWGNSLVVDPWGRVIARAADTEQIVFAELDFAVNEQIRRESPIFKHRRTDLYKLEYQAVRNLEKLNDKEMSE